MRTSVLSCLSLRGKVDLLLCNPPYVATDEEEVGGLGISAAWAGGQRGLGVTKAVVDQLGDVLSPSGLAFIVLEQCNKPDQVGFYLFNLYEKKFPGCKGCGGHGLQL